MSILKLLFLITFCFVIGMTASLALPAAEPVRHDLAVSLRPAEHRLIATDTITVPADQEKIRFLLHAGLRPSSPDPNVHIIRESSRQGTVPMESFTVTLPRGTRTFTLRYSGTIFHPVGAASGEQARGFNLTPGSISDEGVFLAGSSFWYPQFDTDFVTFSLSVVLPATWDAVSQGTRALYTKTETGTFTKVAGTRLSPRRRSTSSPRDSRNMKKIRQSLGHGVPSHAR
jgi:hypothetical protein